MWALDLGTTNSLFARWDAGAGRPALVELPRIARAAPPAGRLEVPRGVPSAVHVLEDPGFWARVSRSPVFGGRLLLGQLAHIGQPALRANAAAARPNFAPTFKRHLGLEALRPIARCGERAYSAREIAWLFMRELLAEVKAATGERLRELVITHPVEAFESYRAELLAIGKSLGVKRIRFLDEPIAAALGYGLGLQRDRNVLVVDFGGGTLHVALIRLSPGAARKGQAEVLAKAGRDVGGNLVDRWLLEEFCRRLDYALSEESEDGRLWHRLMLAEACRVKEEVFFQESATFHVNPPESLRPLEARLRGEAGTLEVRREDLVQILRDRGLYQTLEGALDAVAAQAKPRLGGAPVDDVLMVGGSTLLPDVFGVIERRFGRDRVRAWQPFEAVAYGAAVFAADRVEPADFIVHDYALLTYDKQTRKPEHTVIVPRGTRFPTAPDLWKRQLVPTCPLGEPERLFKLVVCELGGSEGGRRFGWDGEGRLHNLGAEASATTQLVVKLNEANPTLGYLDPPHSPSDQRPRLEVSFGVNAERWLCATVVDLKTRKSLMRDAPVVRLL